MSRYSLRSGSVEEATGCDGSDRVAYSLGPVSIQDDRIVLILRAPSMEYRMG